MTSTTVHKAKNSRLEILAMVQNSAKRLAPVWPLDHFIACNPLQGYEDLHFAAALAQTGSQRTQHAANQALQAVNLQMIKWCSGFFDAGQSRISLPFRDQGLYAAFTKLACFDDTLHQHQQKSKDFLRALPAASEDAIQLCLQKLTVPPDEQADFITQSLLYLPGWAGFVKWKTAWYNPITPTEKPQVTLDDFLAVRLIITCLLWPDAIRAEQQGDDQAWASEVVQELTLRENNYRDNLLTAILQTRKHPLSSNTHYAAQFVFCIDVRSEPFRRAIESLGHYATYGFAGFFGIPVRVHEFASQKIKDCCPVLLKPRFEIDEIPQATKPVIARFQRGKRILSTFKNLYGQLKYNFATPFAMVESLGIWYGLAMLYKSIAPASSSRFFQACSNFLATPLPTAAAYELDPSNLDHGIALTEQIDYAETILRLIGLTCGFAPKVIFCGHGSSTTNNPYASALDCGACGGNHGDMNAKLLAAILNKPTVRTGLADHGIHIPKDCVFYGALHDTTTDAVEIYRQANQSPADTEFLSQLTQHLAAARIITNQERAAKLKSHQPHQDIIRRSVDWSETRPEWGLAQNAAFIAAPRELTQHIHLDGRCFLHSYSWLEDNEGTLLETILTAPMVVAQWINAQYLFSTLNNVAYGSGSKITHNVVGKIGIMQGNGSDLMHGLPLQSVMSSDNVAYHQPQRLLALVYAPRTLVQKIVNKQSILKTLFCNEWVQLVVIDPHNQRPYHLANSGDWMILN